MNINYGKMNGTKGHCQLLQDVRFTLIDETINYLSSEQHYIKIKGQIAGKPGSSHWKLNSRDRLPRCRAELQKGPLSGPYIEANVHKNAGVQLFTSRGLDGDGRVFPSAEDGSIYTLST